MSLLLVFEFEFEFDSGTKHESLVAEQLNGKKARVLTLSELELARSVSG